MPLPRAHRLPIALFAVLLVLSPAGHGAAAQPAADAGSVTFVDDRGEPLGAPVEACFVQDLGTDCVEVPAEASGVDWRTFDLLRVEGADHGPVTVRRSAVRPGEGGVRRLTVPRKATLRVRRPPADRVSESLSAALYPLADPDPLRPAHRIELPAGEPGKIVVETGIPAGEWILALESRGSAPALHRLAVVPGGGAIVSYRPRAGWSLVVRARSAPDREAGGETEGEPVADAAVLLRPPADEARSREDAPPSYPPARTAETDEHGLAFVSGIGSAAVDVAVVHQDFVDAVSPGIAGPPGGFVVHDQELERGGRLEVAIVADGEPGAGWRCSLIDEAAGRVARLESAEPGALERGSAEADRDGICVLERMPPGVLLLRVEEPPRTASGGSGPVGAAERSVRVIGGETVRIDLDLAPIPIDGTVTRGDRGLPGQTIRVLSVGDRPTTGADTVAAEATTGEEGEYAVTVWEPGKYLIFLMDRFGHPTDNEFLDLGPQGDTVDFRLAEHGLRGIVVAEEGGPPPGLKVIFVWRPADGAGVAHTSVTPRPDGAFAIPLPAGGGTAELFAQAPEGSRSETVTIPVAEDVEIPRLILHLKRPSGLRGVLTTAAGSPVADGVVASFPLAGGSGGGDSVGFARTRADGTFEIDPGPGPLVRLWATAVGCPLLRADVRVPAPGPEEAPVSLVCPGSSGTLRLRFRDPEGAPVAGYLVSLVVGGDPLPVAVLGQHLGNLGLAFSSNASGELVVPGLPPGPVEVRGPAGALGATSVPAGGVAELEMVVEVPRPAGGR